MHKPARVLIVDDHPVVLFGLQLLLRDHPRYCVCGEASNADDARRLAEELRPHVMVTDLVMGGRDGHHLIEDVVAASPGTRIVVYSSQEETVHAREALRSGARAYVSKTEGLETVERAIVAVLAGLVYLRPGVPAPWRVSDEAATRPAIDDLSPREQQVLTLMGRGLDLQSLARELSLSVKTIGTYRERLKIKLGLDSVRSLERLAAARLPENTDG
ncbi:response regulator transcription factor [Brevundimonas sp. SORGH_AS_0993]|uniref:response regulator transcription factor n=1 Tax=Brevundimonas sp. SORGH_AS_0993 TaxID=3041794 RepID=UPI00278119D4|nr:response regulator transcription factor [Brevundimonas sp. SORGH_AS_0993]MDQ1155171.1 two-component system response regulator NreC [Brevundimonas sp. SORGH_AS_0993]